MKAYFCQILFTDEKDRDVNAFTVQLLEALEAAGYTPTEATATQILNRAAYEKCEEIMGTREAVAQIEAAGLSKDGTPGKPKGTVH